MKTKNKKTIVNIFLVAIILGILTWFGIEKYKEERIRDENYKVQ